MPLTSVSLFHNIVILR